MSIRSGLRKWLESYAFLRFGFEPPGVAPVGLGDESSKKLMVLLEALSG